MEQKINLVKRNVGHVVVIAPPSSGKSVLLLQLKHVLENLGATVIEERPLQEPLEDKVLKDWEIEMLKSTVWILREESNAQQPKAAQ